MDIFTNSDDEPEEPAKNQPAAPESPIPRKPSASASLRRELSPVKDRRAFFENAFKKKSPARSPYKTKTLPVQPPATLMIPAKEDGEKVPFRTISVPTRWKLPKNPHKGVPTNGPPAKPWAPKATTEERDEVSDESPKFSDLRQMWGAKAKSRFKSRKETRPPVDDNPVPLNQEEQNHAQDADQIASHPIDDNPNDATGDGEAEHNNDKEKAVGAAYQKEPEDGDERSAAEEKTTDQRPETGLLVSPPQDTMQNEAPQQETVQNVTDIHARITSTLVQTILHHSISDGLEIRHEETLQDGNIHPLNEMSPDDLSFQKQAKNLDLLFHGDSHQETTRNEIVHHQQETTNAECVPQKEDTTQDTGDQQQQESMGDELFLQQQQEALYDEADDEADHEADHEQPEESTIHEIVLQQEIMKDETVDQLSATNCQQQEVIEDQAPHQRRQSMLEEDLSGQHTTTKDEHAYQNPRDLFVQSLRKNMTRLTGVSPTTCKFEDEEGTENGQLAQVALDFQNYNCEGDSLGSTENPSIQETDIELNIGDVWQTIPRQPDEKDGTAQESGCKSSGDQPLSLDRASDVGVPYYAQASDIDTLEKPIRSDATVSTLCNATQEVVESTTKPSFEVDTDRADTRRMNNTSSGESIENVIDAFGKRDPDVDDEAATSKAIVFSDDLSSSIMAQVGGTDAIEPEQYDRSGDALNLRLPYAQDETNPSGVPDSPDRFVEKLQIHEIPSMLMNGTTQIGRACVNPANSDHTVSLVLESLAAVSEDEILQQRTVENVEKCIWATSDSSIAKQSLSTETVESSEKYAENVVTTDSSHGKDILQLTNPGHAFSTLETNRTNEHVQIQESREQFLPPCQHALLGDEDCATKAAHKDDVTCGLSVGVVPAEKRDTARESGFENCLPGQIADPSVRNEELGKEALQNKHFVDIDEHRRNQRQEIQTLWAEAMRLVEDQSASTGDQNEPPDVAMQTTVLSKSTHLANEASETVDRRIDIRCNEDCSPVMDEVHERGAPEPAVLEERGNLPPRPTSPDFDSSNQNAELIDEDIRLRTYWMGHCAELDPEDATDVVCAGANSCDEVCDIGNRMNDVGELCRQDDVHSHTGSRHASGIIEDIDGCEDETDVNAGVHPVNCLAQTRGDVDEKETFRHLVAPGDEEMTSSYTPSFSNTPQLQDTATCASTNLGDREQVVNHDGSDKIQRDLELPNQDHHVQQQICASMFDNSIVDQQTIPAAQDVAGIEPPGHANNSDLLDDDLTRNTTQDDDDDDDCGNDPFSDNYGDIFDDWSVKDESISSTVIQDSLKLEKMEMKVSESCNVNKKETNGRDDDDASKKKDQPSQRNDHLISNSTSVEGQTTMGPSRPPEKMILRTFQATRKIHLPTSNGTQPSALEDELSNSLRPLQPTGTCTNTVESSTRGSAPYGFQDPSKASNADSDTTTAKRKEKKSTVETSQQSARTSVPGGLSMAEYSRRSAEKLRKLRELTETFGPRQEEVQHDRTQKMISRLPAVGPTIIDEEVVDLFQGPPPTTCEKSEGRTKLTRVQPKTEKRARAKALPEEQCTAIVQYIHNEANDERTSIETALSPRASGSIAHHDFLIVDTRKTPKRERCGEINESTLVPYGLPLCLQQTAATRGSGEKSELPSSDSGVLISQGGNLSLSTEDELITTPEEANCMDACAVS